LDIYVKWQINTFEVHERNYSNKMLRLYVLEGVGIIQVRRTVVRTYVQ